MSRLSALDSRLSARIVSGFAVNLHLCLPEERQQAADQKQRQGSSDHGRDPTSPVRPIVHH